MRTLVVILLLIVFCGFTSLSVADYKADYGKIILAYKTHRNISFKVSYKSYDKDAGKSDTVITGRYQIKGKKFKTRILGTEAIRNDKYYLAVDHNNEMIFLHKASAVPGDFYPISNIDTLVKSNSVNVSGVELNNGKTRRYEIKNNSKYIGGYTKAICEFDVNSYLVTKVVMHLPARENVYKQPNWPYLADPFVEFNYYDYNFNDIDDAVFSMDKYIIIKEEGKKVEPTEAYKNYRIVNSILISQQIR